MEKLSEKLLNNKFICLFCVLIYILIIYSNTLSYAYDYEYYEVNNGFIAFCRCEIPKSIAKKHFNAIGHEIVSITLYESHQEGELLIVSGNIVCNLKDKLMTIYIILGVKDIFGYLKVSYLYTSTTNETLLASELVKYPYQGVCEWSEVGITVY